MLHQPDWNPELLTEIGLDIHGVEQLGSLLDEYLAYFQECYQRKDATAVPKAPGIFSERSGWNDYIGRIRLPPKRHPFGGYQSPVLRRAGQETAGSNIL